MLSGICDVFEAPASTVITTPKNLIDAISNLEQIIFIEKPKRLEYSVLNGKRESCINQVQQDNFLNNGMGLFGEGVIVGIADSGERVIIMSS